MPIEARATHDNDVFRLRVGAKIVKVGEIVRKPRVGQVEERRFETEGATVVALFPGLNMAETDGAGGWAVEARFHSMSVTEWADEAAGE
jgi:hypothetical protein